MGYKANYGPTCRWYEYDSRYCWVLIHQIGRPYETLNKTGEILLNIIYIG